MEIQLWKDILNPYELAVEELLVKFNHLIKEYQDRGMYSPMEHVCGRVKSISSILDKAQKKNIEVDKIEEQLDDIAGIRIICQFVEDIEKVADLIRNRSDMQIVTEKEPETEETASKEVNVTGVYCVSGAKARFKPVEVLLTGDDYAVVRSAGSTEKLRLRPGDEIIVAARDLYDGKVVS